MQKRFAQGFGKPVWFCRAGGMGWFLYAVAWRLGFVLFALQGGEWGRHSQVDKLATALRESYVWLCPDRDP